MTILTGLTAAITPILYWIAGYLSAMVLVHRGRVPAVTLSNFVTGLLLAVVFVTCMVVLDLYRTGDQYENGVINKAHVYSEVIRLDNMETRWGRYRFGLFGHVYSFSHYFSHIWQTDIAPLWGSTVFVGPMDMLNLGAHRAPFETFWAEPGVEPNVYTMFRPPIDDFGLVGSLVWWFLIGLSTGWAFGRASKGRILPCALLVAFYIEVALPGGFFFRYNSIIASYIVVFGYLLVVTHLSVRKRRLIEQYYLKQRLGPAHVQARYP